MSTLMKNNKHYVIAAFFSVLLLSACSDSSDSTTESSSSNPDSGTIEGDIQGVPDPQSQNVVQVDFEITVPAYVSNSLQVRLTWGDKDMKAKWVGDEFWSVSDNFPTNTENNLLVKFNDDNGDITLGSFEAPFKTDTNALQVYQINAEQFDTNSWDADNDGASNINELIAGTDPLVDEESSLVVQEPFERPDALGLLANISDHYESQIPAERPYSVLTDEVSSTDYETDRKTQTITIDIDASGNGSFSDEYMFREAYDYDVTVETRLGTRTRIENTVGWTGSYYRLNNSAYRGEDVKFTVETTMIDSQTRTQTGTIESKPIGGQDQPIDVSYALTGELIDNSSRCLPMHGSIEFDTPEYLDERMTTTNTTIKKEPEGQYWLVSKETVDGVFLDEFLVNSVDFTFFCEFEN